MSMGYGIEGERRHCQTFRKNALAKAGHQHCLAAYCATSHFHSDWVWPPGVGFEEPQIVMFSCLSPFGGLTQFLARLFGFWAPN